MSVLGQSHDDVHHGHDVHCHDHHGHVHDGHVHDVDDRHHDDLAVKTDQQTKHTSQGEMA